jgi:hypothetical protein
LIRRCDARLDTRKPLFRIDFFAFATIPKTMTFDRHRQGRAKKL